MAWEDNNDEELKDLFTSYLNNLQPAKILTHLHGINRKAANYAVQELKSESVNIK